MAVFLCPRASTAQPNLVIDPDPVTWNVIGLDSNNVLVGPQDFPVGIRVLNTGTTDATNVTATFTWASANIYVNLLDEDQVTTTVIPAGGYADFYFTVRVTRNAAAYDTSKQYTISLTGGGLVMPLTITETLYVEGLVSQQANDVLSLVGPPEIQEGEVRTFILTSETQTNKDQLENFVNFPNDIFQILDVQMTFTNPTGGQSDRFYLDACGWIRTAPPSNTSCSGPDMYGGAVGGDVVTIYTVYVLQTPPDTINLSALILDRGGNALHYNADFGDNILPVRPPTDIFVIKSAVDNPVEAGDTVEYLLSVVNADPDTQAKDVVLSDTLPAGLTFVSSNPAPTSGPNPLLWNIGNIDGGSSKTVSLILQTSCNTTGSLTNYAFASTTSRDSNAANNLTSQTIVVQDTTPPIITCPANIVQNADPNTCGKSSVPFTVTATDNCTTVSVNSVPASGSSFSVGTQTVTATATDASGNTATCQFTVTIIDVQPPTIACPLPDVIFSADAMACSKANVSLTSPTVSDNCTTTPVVITATRSDMLAMSAPFPVGSTTVTWKATDASGLMATCNQQVIVQDNTPPGIVCPSNITVGSTLGQCGAENVGFSVTGTDNCGTPVITTDPLPGTMFAVGTTTVTAKATDTAGNMTTCTFTVTVNDTENPTIECPPAVSVSSSPGSCSATGVTLGEPTVDDNCGIANVVGVRSDMLALNAAYPVGTTTITWTVTDTAGRTASCMQTVTVTDDTDPMITCPPTINVTADPLTCSAANVTTTAPLTSDNCATATLIGVRSDAQPLSAPYPVGTTIITWTVTDAAMNSESCQQLVIVRDVTPPSITCPTTLNVVTDSDACEASGVTITTPTVTADNCSTTPVVITGSRSDMLSLNAPYPIGNTTIIWKATDAANNMTTCPQLVIVTDDTDPEIICPEDVTVNVSSQNCEAAMVDIGDPEISDNCSNPMVNGVRSDSKPLSDPYPLGMTTITWTVTDGAGNTDTCTQKVTVNDTTPPTITCPPAIDVTADPLTCSAANVTTTAPLTNDNCSTASLIGVRSDMLSLASPFPVGTTIITWTVTDGWNNSTSCTQTVTVRDVTPPAITCPSTITVAATGELCAAADVTITTPTITSDNCSTATIAGVRSDMLALNAPYPVGLTTITWTVTDSSGNTANCLQNVIVRDATPPAIVCPMPINVNADAMGCEADDVVITPPMVSDNCTTEPLGVAGVRDDMLALDAPYPVGDTVITWTVTDSAGNTASCTQQVTVNDVTDPTITCGPTVNVAASALNCMAADVVVTAPLTSDNCSTATLVGTRSDMLALTAPYPLGTTTITWTVTDTSGNTEMCVQNVVVTDQTAPTVICPMTITQPNTPGMCGAVVTFNITTSDACGNSSVTVVASPASGSFFSVGTTTVNVTATDGAGNTSRCSFDVVVNDTQLPSIVCPPPIMTCMQDVVLSTPLTADNCATSTLTATRSDNLPLSADYPVGTTVVTWTVTDIHGNSNSCTQSVMVSDSVLPSIICPEDYTIPALAGLCVSGPVDYPEPSVMDNCSTDTTNLTITYSPPEGSALPIGENVVTITVTDSMMNSARCSFTVTVEDVTPPSLQCPANITVSNTTGQCGASSVSFILSASDSCSTPVTVVANPPSGSPFAVGVTTVTVTATDAADNVTTCSFTVTVNDTQPPFITCPPAVNVAADAGQCLAATVNLGQPMTGDNCATASLTAVRSDGQPLSAPYPVGVTTVTWTVTDSTGNTASCTQMVTVRDATMPTITCPPDISVNALAGQCISGPVTYGPATVADNCSTGTEGLSVTFVPPSGTAFPIGMNTVTATVTDRAGNTASCTFKVTVNDVTPPQVSCPANITVSNTSGQCGATAVTYTPVATDACSNPVTIVATPPSGSPFPVGTTTVNVTATDSAGNSSNCSFTVTVNDTQPPSITCPPTVNVMADTDQCQAANLNLGLPVTGDNCSTASVTAVRSDMQPLSAPYPVGTTTVTWTVTDSAGNTATCTQQVIVRDTMMPTITCPADVTVPALAGQCISGPVQYGQPVVSDNCTPTNQLTVTYNPPQGSTFPVGTTPVTVTVTDMSGNQSICTFNVIVNDVTPPLLTCPANITVSNTSGQCGASAVTFNIVSTDPCSGPVTVVATPASGSTFPVGTTTVNVTATDTAGNTATCSFTVTVNDTQPPTITCPPTVNVNANAMCQAVNVNLGLPVTADNCSTASVTSVRSDMQPLEAPYPIGTTTVTWTVADSAGNTATCTQTVNVTDSTMPTITCPADITVPVLSGSCLSGPVQYPNPTVSDNCSTQQNLTVTFNPPQGSTFPLGTNPVTVTVADQSGNTATCTFNVIVQDVTPPLITCPANIIATSAADQCGLPNVTFTATATDNCAGPVTVVSVPASGSTFPVGTTTVTSTATDAAGNTATCSFTVTVQDTTPPALVCPEPLVVPASSGECQALNVTYSATAPDNCSGPVTVTFNPPSGSNFPVGVSTVQVTATDSAGNIATCSFTVTVEDRDAPRISCQADVTVQTVPCELDAVVVLVEPETMDSCESSGPVTVVGVRSDNRPLTDRYPIGQTIVTWTATDASGNSASCQQAVNVEESQCQPVCDGPDLVIMTKMAPSYKCSKSFKCKVDGWYIVTNIGTQTSGETSVCFYLSEDTVLDPGDFQFKQSKKYRVKSLRPGEMVGVDLKGKGPKGVNVADYYVIAVVDCPNVVVECREDNNTVAEHPMPKMK